MKKQLKILALTSSMLFGLTTTNWGAPALIQEGGALANGATKTMTSKFGLIAMAGDLSAANATLVMSQPESDAYIVGGAATVTLTAVTPTRDSTLHLMGGAGGVTVTAATAPTSGSAYIRLCTGTVTLPVGLSTSFKVISDYFVGAAGTTLTGSAAGTFAPDIEINAPLTIATITELSGAISGKGQLIGGSLERITGSMRHYSGDYVTGGALTLSALAPKGGIQYAGNHTVTVKVSGTLGRLMGAATFTGVLIAENDITINELDLRHGAITLAPAPSARITIKSITPGSDNNLTIGNGTNLGTVKILRGSTSGTVSVVTGATLE